MIYGRAPGRQVGCLMTNHIHLLVVPERPNSLALTIQRVHSEYSSLVNRKHLRVQGHLWQSRFYSCPVEADRLWTVLRYIELNPVRARMVQEAAERPWSSAAARAGQSAAPWFLAWAEWEAAWTAGGWREALAVNLCSEQAHPLRQATARGLPWGTEEFVRERERRVGRSLRVRAVGRPARERALAAGQSGLAG